jgi:hypothetical protein
LAAEADKIAEKRRADALVARNALKVNLRKRVIEFARGVAGTGKRHFYLFVSDCYLINLSGDGKLAEKETFEEMKKNDGIEIVPANPMMQQCSKIVCTSTRHCHLHRGENLGCELLADCFLLNLGRCFLP